MERNSLISMPKITQELKGQILDKCYTIAFPQAFRQRINDNNVNIHFNTYPKDEVQYWENRYSNMIYELISTVCDFRDYREEGCQHGNQIFEQTEDGTDIVKRWSNDSYDKVKDHPK